MGAGPARRRLRRRAGLRLVRLPAVPEAGGHGLRRPEGRLDQVHFVACGDLAGRYDAGEHPALSVELRLQAGPDLLHARARVADHRDLELRFADAKALADGPGVDVVSLDREVLPDSAVVDAKRVQVLGGCEQDLPLRARPRMRAAFEPMALDRAHPVARVHSAAALGG